MATKFTPGPWGVETTAETLWIGPMRPDGKKLEDIVGRIGCEPDLKPEVRDEVTANAHLIAAAPDLYEALETLYCVIGPVRAMDVFNSGMERVAIGQMVEAALAKARGESL